MEFIDSFITIYDDTLYIGIRYFPMTAFFFFFVIVRAFTIYSYNNIKHIFLKIIKNSDIIYTQLIKITLLVRICTI